MRILVSYSKFHFDPEREEFVCHSASVIARSIYEVCKGLCNDVTYIDASTEAGKVRGERFDIFIGIVANFRNIYRSIETQYAILLETTTHHANRKRVLQKEAKRLNCPLEEILPLDSEYHESLRIADLILVLGTRAASTFVQNGVDRRKIIPISYSMDHVPFYKRSFTRPYKFLYIATELNLRKGAWHVLSNFKNMSGDFQLTMVGGVTNKFFADIISETVTRSGGKIRYLGWIESNSAEYRRLLQEHQFFVFPSLEEGGSWNGAGSHEFGFDSTDF